ncbi:MAG: hypothetical protein AB1390_06960 [Nitrospirota bacterium]
MKNKIIVLAIFGIAMGFLEAAVVVYLRQLYYPEGFAFPLKQMALQELSIEYLREISTITMLVSIGILSGRNFYDRFSYFVVSFGIWDIFYYVWLKLLLDWPESLLTWDILFLVPIIWAGPVLAPLICAATMIVIGGVTLYLLKRRYPVRIMTSEALLLLTGAFVIFLAFVWNYAAIIIHGGFITEIFSLGSNPDFHREVSRYVPSSFKWTLFAFGETLFLCFLVIFVKRVRSRPRYK